ncbi:hypothetical protein N658DRAFT_527579 [Parathielavia hyrcaniae]|uniref:Uncharacterized protein n=1 Tax=Parathielavia hyrcaniae TaxID=113614 RepID=A0AAN6PW83_9PEZI|nr:hypothetical protein N658DRAFT_527579 [Parathielavia hyrcaniae]
MAVVWATFGSPLYLTGDNNGNVINYWMNGGVYPPVNVRHFSIYKISHHGSREDSEITPAAGQPGQCNAAPINVIKETCLMMMLIATNKNPNKANHANPRLLTPEARKLVNRGRDGLNYPRNCYNLQNAVLQAVEEALVARHLLWDMLVDDVKYSKYFRKPLSLETRPLRAARNSDPDYNPDNQWKKRKIDNNAAQNVPVINQPQTQANAMRWGDVLGWWVAWWGGKHGGNKGIWTDLYNDIKQLGRTQAFFRSFTADAYVVSANFHQHGHPNVEVLVDLAWALRHMGRFATLYLTNIASFKKDEFESMCRFVNLDPNVLGTNLVIRYPHTEHTMSLTANPPVTQQYLDERGINHLDAANVPRDARGNFVSGIHDFGRTTRVLEEVGQGEDWATVCKTRDDKLENVSAWDAMLRSTATVFELQSLYTQQFVTLTERHLGTLEFDVDLTATRTQLRVRESYYQAVDNRKMNVLFLSRTPTSGERVVIWVNRVGVCTDSLYQVVWLDENNHMKAFYLDNNNTQLAVDNYDENAAAEPASFRFSSIEPHFAHMVHVDFANLTLSDTTVPPAGTVVDLGGLDDDDDDGDGTAGGIGGNASGARGSVARRATSGNLPVIHSSMAVSNMAT